MDFFSLFLFKGVSKELGGLHKQTFDLMGIKVLQNDQSGTPIESATVPKGTSVNDESHETCENLDTQVADKFSGPDLTRENGIEGSDEPSVTGDDDNVKTGLVENKQDENYNLTLDDNENATQIPMSTTASVEEANASQLKPSEDAVETGIDKTDISLDDAENNAPAGVESLYLNNGALGGVGDNSTGLLVTACDESKDMDAPVLTDASCMPTDHVMCDPDVAMIDMSNDRLLNASKLQEDNTVDITQIDSEPRAEGSVLFEAAQVDAAVEVKTFEDIRDVEYDPQVLTNNGICGEQPTLDLSYSAGVQVPVLDFAMDGEIPFQQETHLPNMFDAEVSGTELHDPDVSSIVHASL